MPYTAPLQQMRFLLTHVADIDAVGKLPGYEAVSPELAQAVLDEAAALAQDVWAKTNRPGDRQGAVLHDGQVRTADGFKDAYDRYVQGGWNSLTADTNFGGQGLPHCLSMAVTEMWQSANLALSLCPLLTQAAIEAISVYGTEEQKQAWLPKMISGQWPGTMNLTEPQAGTDLAALRTLARENGDHYLIKGQKIFITFGDHDLSDNIVHLVLAMIEGLPAGNNGMGLFIVPKYLLDGKRNDVQAVSLEHKLGIHGSPTCVMSFGDKDGAVGYLLGAPGEGLKNMFTMMNNARIGVGLQGVAIAERAYQRALAYAQERVQGAKMGDRSGKRVAIIEHPDVRRMLMTMKAQTIASRALTYYAGACMDRLKQGVADPSSNLVTRVDLLTPLVKAFATDMACETASLGVQVHGGMGYIEETGAAQYYRDARILPIYEGTNGIQANDLVFRKVARDQGVAVKALADEMRRVVESLSQESDLQAKQMGVALETALGDLETATAWVVDQADGAAEKVAASAVPYLRLFSLCAGGFMMARLLKAALTCLQENDGDPKFLKGQITAAVFYAEALLPQTKSLLTIVMNGHASLVKVGSESLFAQ